MLQIVILVIASLIAATPWQMEKVRSSFGSIGSTFDAALAIRLAALIVVVLIARHLGGLLVPVAAVALLAGIFSQRN
jgi:uncharacterized membrane protein